MIKLTIILQTELYEACIYFHSVYGQEQVFEPISPIPE